MDVEIKKIKFDDQAREAAARLLESFWVLRDREPELYAMIREREAALRAYFLDKCGYRLIVHRGFARLEKIPATPEPWMGIQAFKSPRDYALLCCLLAFLEERDVDEQFLLTDLCEDLKQRYPRAEDASADPEGAAGPIAWERWGHRMALVRVLRYAIERGLLAEVDGDSSAFGLKEETEALFETPLVSRYFMISFPKDLFRFNTLEEILAGGEIEADDPASAAPQRGAARRHRVYRSLLLSPVLYAHETPPEDFLYLRNTRNRLREDFEAHTPYRLELYKNAALLTVADRKSWHTGFPDQRAIADIVLLFAAVVRDARRDSLHEPREDGALPFSEAGFDKLVQRCRRETGHGWSKEFRDMADDKLTETLLAELIDWKMARREAETGLILLEPLLGRLTGRYPREFVRAAEEEPT